MSADGASNLVLFLADQHSRQAMGCYGNRDAVTPHLDALAAAGTRFAHAYTPSPICVPARAAIATGRYPHQTACWDNSAPYRGDAFSSWGHRLSAAGHPVTTIGKLHYASSEDDTGFPDQRIPLHVVDGRGMIFNLLRGDMPPMTQLRKHVLEAGPGESDYTRYDREVTRLAVEWLRTEAAKTDGPWVLVVSWASPHYPLQAPEEFYRLYDPEALRMPTAWSPDQWSRHPAHEFQRYSQGQDTPFDERTVRRALAAYYGLVSFIDAQVGSVVQALADADLTRPTRTIYTSDHGDMMGEHGLWFKCTMYEAAVGVPMLMAGPDVPAGRVCRTNASLVDLFLTVLSSVGVQPAKDDADLPGTSLLELARSPDRERVVFSEYHDLFSTDAIYAIRDGRHKYVHYVDQAPELFDLELDPDEMHDLGQDPGAAPVRRRLEHELGKITGDPTELDHRVKRDQQRRLAEAGGADQVLSAGVTISYTPTPTARA
jgi:choline-sulfatase